MRHRTDIQLLQIPIAQPLKSCLQKIEITCTIDCCGIGCLKPIRLLIGLWSGSVGRQKTELALRQARAVLKSAIDAVEPLECSFLNYREVPVSAMKSRAEFRKLFQNVVADLESCS
jgi:hypothetical protein